MSIFVPPYTVSLPFPPFSLLFLYLLFLKFMMSLPLPALTVNALFQPVLFTQVILSFFLVPVIFFFLGVNVVAINFSFIIFIFSYFCSTKQHNKIYCCTNLLLFGNAELLNPPLRVQGFQVYYQFSVDFYSNNHTPNILNRVISIP